MNDLESYFETKKSTRYIGSLLFWLHLILASSIIISMIKALNPLMSAIGLFYLGLFGYSIYLHRSGEDAKALAITVGSVALGVFFFFGTCVVMMLP